MKMQHVLTGLLMSVLSLSTVTAVAEGETEEAIFAGGCFWCMEPPFDVLDGVLSTTSGYSGGALENPSYGQVSAGRTKHAEVVKVVFDPSKVSYEKLLTVFWHNIDPTRKNAQFCDTGSQYRTGIFFVNEKQGALAQASLQALQKNKPFEQPIVTEITAAGAFWPAESYHQDFYKKSSVRYKFYRKLCGRDSRLEELWGEEG